MATNLFAPVEISSSEITDGTIAAADVGGDISVSVADRTALKALSTSQHTTVFLEESGRSGLFVFRAGDYSANVTADTTEAIYIAATDTASSSGAWVRVYDKNVNVKWFGATGDGVTDDYTAFRKAADLMIALDGGIIYVPIGTYLMNTALQLNGAQGVHIIGESRNKTTLTRGTNLGAAGIRFYLGNGNSVQNLTMDCDGYAGRGIYLQDRYSWCENVRVLNCPERPFSMNGGGNASYGLDSAGLTEDSGSFTTATFFPVGCKFLHCYVKNAGQTAFSCKRMRYYEVRGCYAETVYSEGITVDVGSTHAKVIGNTLYDVALVDSSTAFLDKVANDGSYLSVGTGGTGGLGLDNVTRAVVIGNTIDGVQSEEATVNNRIKVAISFVDNIGASTGCVVANNTIRNAKLGVWLKGTGSGAGGNVFACSVVGNTFEITGTGAGTGSSEYGDIWIDAGCGRNRFIGNTKFGGDLLITDNATLNRVDTDYEVLDEDDMVSNSARRPASQQSIKAYVDGRVPNATTTFTPTLQFGGAAVGMTYGTRSGRYQQHGNVVHFQIEISLSALGSSTGDVTITGLPVSASASAITVLTLRLTQPGTTAPGQPFGEISGTTISLFNDRSLGATVTALTHANFTAAANNALIIQGYYEV